MTPRVAYGACWRVFTGALENPAGSASPQAIDKLRQPQRRLHSGSIVGATQAIIGPP
jgi:hypothetical protein